jgi:hypothetical protein
MKLRRTLHLDAQTSGAENGHSSLYIAQRGAAGYFWGGSSARGAAANLSSYYGRARVSAPGPLSSGRPRGIFRSLNLKNRHGVTQAAMTRDLQSSEGMAEESHPNERKAKRIYGNHPYL